MSDDIAIKVENLTKIYKLYDKHIDRMKESLHIMKKKYHKDFFALKNISFQINKGESVAIVGKNGSGKSTLLKIITGVLTQSSGNVHINGKISALLELGTGFNPEYTGIQNIYLNATMMGYSKDEIDSKVPFITEFADIGDFINQPVKTYSSGMFVRLAFAVAINVDPDILIIDEALAVGDDLFQRKCYAKIEEFRKKNKTIVFVTHSSSTVIELCSRAIFLDAGEQLLVDKSQNVINLYQKLLYAKPESREKIREQIKNYYQSIETNENSNIDIQYSVQSIKTFEDSSENLIIQNDYFEESLLPKNTITYDFSGARLFDYELLNMEGKRVNVIQFGNKYIWKYRAEFFEDSTNVRFGMMIKTSKGLELCGAATHLSSKGLNTVNKGEVFEIEYSFVPKFVEGIYFLNCGILGLNKQGEEFFLHRYVEVWNFKIQERHDSLLSGIVDMDLKSKVSKVV